MSGWRCFHCDDVFTDQASALEHFGFDQGETPACKLSADLAGLIKLVRDQEFELRQFRTEETASYREFYSLGSDHARALQREEEKGYAKGLADARAEFSAPSDPRSLAYREALDAAVSRLRAYVEPLDGDENADSSEPNYRTDLEMVCRAALSLS